MSTGNSIQLPAGVKDETGKPYGKLTVVSYAGKNKRREALWLCLCECGAMTTVVGCHLRNENTRSCSLVCWNTTHGMSKAPEHICWCSLRARCYNPSDSSFGDYGARGIRVSTRWLTSFQNFFEDMGPKPFPEASIGRIDNDGNYEVDNCRWETCEQQANNRRSSRYLTHDGVTQTVSRWAHYLGISVSTLDSRLGLGWSTKEALTTPVGISRSRRARLFTHDGETRTIAGWSRKLGVKRHTLYLRLKKGWPLDKVFVPKIYHYRVPKQ